MPVFISYRHSDRDQAMAINNHLKSNGIETYLDVLDEESKSTDDITSVITKNIMRCTHLIAVVSESTAQSWWVPFEIGEATISYRRIASYRTGYSALPEYLSKWPQMVNVNHLDMFIQSYRTEGAQSRLGMESYGDAIKRKFTSSDAENFHRSLKSKIRGY
jgi:hypothetical protein